MWDHLPVRNLLGLHRLAAIRTIDRQIEKDYRDGYTADVDALLDDRIRLMALIEQECHH